MQFYHYSTTKEIRKISDKDKHPPTTKPHNELHNVPQTNANNYFSFAGLFNAYSIQYLNLSNQLNIQLLKNNQLIQQNLAISLRNQQNKIQSKNSTDDGTSISKNNSSQSSYGTNKPHNCNRQDITSLKAKKKAKKYISEEQQSYQPSFQQQYEIYESKISESKNIPKNYGKAILNFIHKNQDYTDRVLHYLNIDKQQFVQNLQKLKNNLNTISQLRSIWIEESNRFSKAYRIFSIEYLRKHSLCYIFNSRIQNVNKHIKYRYKIIESVQQPESFTCMKQF